MELTKTHNCSFNVNVYNKSVMAILLIVLARSLESWILNVQIQSAQKL